MVLCGTHVAEAKGLLRTLKYSLDALDEIEDMLDSALLMLREAPTEEREKERIRKEKYRKSLRSPVPRDTTGQTRDPVGVGEGAAVAAEEEDAEVATRSNYVADVQSCWDHWRSLRPSTTRKKLSSGDAEYKKTAALLKTGYTADRICTALDGYGRSPFHNGVNDNGYRFTYELVVRNAANVDRGIEMANDPMLGHALSERTRRGVNAAVQFIEEGSNND